MFPSSSPLTPRGSSISTLLSTGEEQALPPWALGKIVPHLWHALPGKSPYYEVNARTEQGILFGLTETGISTTLHRLAFNAARVGWKVFLLDAQGSETRAATFYATMQEAKRGTVRLFPYTPYAGWSGTPDAILHRLLQLSPSREPYYQQIAIASLASVLLGDAPSLHSSHDLLASLTSLLLHRSQQRSSPLLRLLYALRHTDLAGPLLRYAALSCLAGNSLNGTWSYDEADAAYFSFNASSRPDEARMLARFLLADLVSYLTERTKTKTPVLLLINHPEQLFELEQVASLFARMQAAHGSLFLATSSPSDFGHTAHRLMSNASVLLIHRQLSSRPFVPYLALPWWKRNPLRTSVLQGLADHECIAVGNGQVTQIQVAPVPIDAQALLHATKSLSKRQDAPDPLKIDTVPEDEELQTIFKAVWNDPSFQTDAAEVPTAEQFSSDVPKRSHRRSRPSFQKKGALQPETGSAPSSPEKNLEPSTAPKRKKHPVIL